MVVQEPASCEAPPRPGAAAERAILRKMPGKLFVVATPLGNLEDLSSRAVATLREVDCVACEDTRRTALLLARFEIDRPTISCHRFNECERVEPILERLLGGHDLALVSDGGTPGVADPGYRLVRAALDRGIDVRPVPGASAVTALLSVCGLPADRYVFDGFLPHRAGERRRRLRELRDEQRTLVLFETPHRIVDTLGDIDEVLGDRPLVVGREMTKLHETILRGTARQVAQELGTAPRGELTLVVAGAGPGERHREARTERLLDVWRDELRDSAGDKRLALRRASRTLGLKRAELYRRLAELGEAPD